MECIKTLKFLPSCILVSGRTYLNKTFDHLTFHHVPTDGGSGVRILNVCVMFLCVVYVVWSVWVHDSFYGLYYFNLWCVPGSIFWDLWLFLVFLYLCSCCNPWTWSVLRRWSKVDECFFGTHWLGMAGSKGSSGLDASTWRRKSSHFTITSLYVSVRCLF